MKQTMQEPRTGREMAKALNALSGGVGGGVMATWATGVRLALSGQREQQSAFVTYTPQLGYRVRRTSGPFANPAACADWSAVLAFLGLSAQ